LEVAVSWYNHSLSLSLSLSLSHTHTNISHTQIEKDGKGLAEVSQIEEGDFKCVEPTIFCDNISRSKDELSTYILI